MWLNGYFTSSAVVVCRRPPLPFSSVAAILIVCCRRLLPSSSSVAIRLAVVLIVHHRHPSVCQKIRTSAFYPLHPQVSAAKFIHNLPAATSAHLHIRILTLPSFRYFSVIITTVCLLHNYQLHAVGRQIVEVTRIRTTLYVPKTCTALVMYQTVPTYVPDMNHVRKRRSKSTKIDSDKMNLCTKTDCTVTVMDLCGH